MTKIVVKVPMIKDGNQSNPIFSKKASKPTVLWSSPQVGLNWLPKPGATYVSPFIGRVRDISTDGLALIEDHSFCSIDNLRIFTNNPLLLRVRHRPFISDRIPAKQPVNDSVLRSFWRINANSSDGAKDGEKVVVSITEWPKGSKNPVGRVKDVLGKKGENNTEMNAILADYGFPLSFPPEVEKEANSFSAVIDKCRDPEASF
ncbi:hypothetical protein FQR65_LT18557 [Abscondita terminalis]|nr:hypothetical protein FQR65_LT18557 [Abscondita terminalis]